MITVKEVKEKYESLTIEQAKRLREIDLESSKVFSEYEPSETDLKLLEKGFIRIGKVMNMGSEQPYVTDEGKFAIQHYYLN